MPLTEVQIKSLKPKDKPYKKSDGHGLYVLVKPDGRKLWRKKYYFNGKERTHTIGWYPTVKLKEARKERAKVQEQLDKGLDPSLEKKRTNGSLETFYDVAKEWWELNSGLTVELVKKEKYKHRALSQLVHSSRDVLNTKYAISTWRRLEIYVFSDLGSHSINDIKAIDISRVLNRVIATGHTDVPKKVLQHLRNIFTHALIGNRCDSNPCFGLEKTLPKYKTEHQKSIDFKDMPHFFESLGKSTSSPLVILAIKLLILTCLRSSELRYAEWKEFDFESKQWKLPAERMKMNREHIVPLTEQMITILNEAKKYSGDNKFVFFSRIASAGVLSGGTLNAAINRIGYKGLATPHGFRTTARTEWAEAGFNDWAIELQLSHGDPSAVRGAYNYKTELLKERREMMVCYSEKLIDAGLVIC